MSDRIRPPYRRPQGPALASADRRPDPGSPRARPPLALRSSRCLDGYDCAVAILRSRPEPESADTRRLPPSERGRTTAIWTAWTFGLDKCEPFLPAGAKPLVSLLHRPVRSRNGSGPSTRQDVRNRPHRMGRQVSDGQGFQLLRNTIRRSCAAPAPCGCSPLPPAFSSLHDVAKVVP